MSIDGFISSAPSTRLHVYIQRWPEGPDGCILADIFEDVQAFSIRSLDQLGNLPASALSSNIAKFACGQQEVAYYLHMVFVRIIALTVACLSLLMLLAIPSHAVPSYDNALISGCQAFKYESDVPEQGVLLPGQSIACTVQMKQDPGVRTRIDFHSNQDRLSFEPASIVLTETDWSWPREIKVTAVEDEWMDPRRSLVGVDAWIRAQDRDYPYYNYAAYDSVFFGLLGKIAKVQQETKGELGKAGHHLFPAFGYNYGYSTKKGNDDEFLRWQRSVRIGAVEVVEASPQQAFLVHPASQLTDVEGKLPGAIWIRPAKRPRRHVTVTGYQYGSSSISTRENWLRFSPDNWQAYQPLYYGRYEDMTKQKPQSAHLLIATAQAEYPLDNYNTHAYLTWPYPRGYGHPEYPRWMRPSQAVKVQVLDNDRRSRPGWFVIAGGQRAPDQEPAGRVQISFGCSQQEFISRDAVASGRLAGARAWKPAPTATHKGLPEIGFRGHLWAKDPRGKWRKIGTNKLAHAYQMIVPNYQWQDGIVVIPRWSRALRVTCETPKGLPTFNEPVSLHLQPPTDSA